MRNLILSGLVACLAFSPVAAAQEREYPRFKIEYMIESVIKPTLHHKERTTVTVKDDEALFHAYFGHAFVGRTTSAGSLSYLGKEATLSSGAILVPAKVTGGDLSRLDMLMPAFCLDTEFDESRGIATLFTLGIADMVAAFDRQTTFCLMDIDKNGTLETGLLAGIRNGKLRKKFPVDPISYGIVRDYIRSGHLIRLRYHVGTLFSKPRLTMLVGNSSTGGVFKFKANNADGKWTEFRSEINFSDSKIPETFDFLTMRYTLIGMSKEDKMATFRVDKRFKPTPICRDC